MFTLFRALWQYLTPIFHFGHAREPPRLHGVRAMRAANGSSVHSPPPPRYRQIKITRCCPARIRIAAAAFPFRGHRHCATRGNRELAPRHLGKTKSSRGVARRRLTPGLLACCYWRMALVRAFARVWSTPPFTNRRQLS
ncbi:MAG: hypothetical protein WBF43_05980 [Methylocella sp.]